MSGESKDAAFNGNARDPEAVYVPAADFLHVGHVIKLLGERRSLDDLVVEVRPGALQLGDETGSYGRRTWGATMGGG